MEALYFIIGTLVIIVGLYIFARRARKDDGRGRPVRRSSSSSDNGLMVLFALFVAFFMIPWLLKGKGSNNSSSKDNSGLGILILVIIVGAGAALWYFHGK